MDQRIPSSQDRGPTTRHPQVGYVVMIFINQLSRTNAIKQYKATNRAFLKSIRMSVCLPVYLYVCVYVCMFVCMYI